MYDAPGWDRDQEIVTKEGGAFALLDDALERLEKSLSVLAATVGPISNQYAGVEVTANEPKSEPSTQLHGRIERLRDLTERLDSIQRRIEL
jgi:hypothetical protein